jgi:CheY-like chemotaxis protein
MADAVSGPHYGAAPTILVVEDEPIIRADICEYLRGHGFQAVEAGDALEAINLLLGNGAIQAVFTDVQMSGAIDGFGLRRWIQENRPHVKVLLTSGVANLVAAAGHLGQPRWIIFKPYGAAEVEKRLRELLLEKHGMNWPS